MKEQSVNSINSSDLILYVPSRPAMAACPGPYWPPHPNFIRLEKALYLYQCTFPDCEAAFGKVAQMTVHREGHRADAPRLWKGVQLRSSKSSLSIVETVSEQGEDEGGQENDSELALYAI